MQIVQPDLAKLRHMNQNKSIPFVIPLIIAVTFKMDNMYYKV